jgi:hypothetical protein
MVCSRISHSLIFRSALISLITAAAFAQTVPATVYKAPPEIDKALRARVSEFFQFHVEGNFRKAYNMVAEDTQDYYFAALKMKFEAFRITGVRFTNDTFTTASVDLETQQKMNRMQFRGVVVPLPMTTLWKIENGQWVWYRDPNNREVTPMGLSDLGKTREEQGAPPPDLAKLTAPDEIARRANDILKQSGIDKNEVTMALDKPSSAQVSFHNGWPGSIELALDPGANMAGFTATLDKSQLGKNEDAVVKISYTPPPVDPGQIQQPPPMRQVRLMVSPFNLVYPVTVKFEKPGAGDH